MGAGGSEAVVMELLGVCQARFRTSLATGAPFDCERLNRTYAGKVCADRLDVRMAPTPKILRTSSGGDALRGAFFERLARRVAPEFDLCISGYNFTDFGRPAIQLIADFSWDDEVRRAFDPVSDGLRGLVQGPNPARRAYLAAADTIRGHRHDLRIHDRDIIVANSRWTSDVLAQRHGLESRVIYPPVHAPRSSPQVQRSNDFVMLGRIDPSKRVIEGIEVLARVRARGHQVELHVIGPVDRSAYSRLVRRCAAAHGDWVHLHGGLYEDEKFTELARHSFGLHMRTREAFGIAVAEMIKMGLVPFVPAGSAPTEMISDDRLTFESPDHAVEVIDCLLRAPEQLPGIKRGLSGRARLFSREAFAREAAALIDEAVERFRSPGEPRLNVREESLVDASS
jgi:glycosyltransferase involved in cell wall biosynthesis